MRENNYENGELKVLVCLSEIAETCYCRSLLGRGAMQRINKRSNFGGSVFFSIGNLYIFLFMQEVSI